MKDRRCLPLITQKYKFLFHVFQEHEEQERMAFLYSKKLPEDGIQETSLTGLKNEAMSEFAHHIVLYYSSYVDM